MSGARCFCRRLRQPTTGAGTPTPDTSAAALTPGTYTATVTGHNAPITIEVTVTDQAIESINVVESSETAGDRHQRNGKAD